MNTQLRFPQFTDEWQVKKLGDITTRMQSGLSRKLSNTDIGLPVIRSNNIQDQSIKTSDISYWYVKDPQGAKTESYFLENGDLLINFINSLSQIGKFAIYKDELNRPAIFTTNIMRLSFSKDVNADFIFYSLCSKRYTDYIQSITKPAVNQASFTTVDLKKFKLKLPSLDEQEKIAEFLTAVDERIALMEKKLELLKKYKKGVMQKICPPAGGQAPKIRFKPAYRSLGEVGGENGKNYPDWQERKLSEIADFIQNGLAADQNLHNNGYKVTRIETISGNTINTKKVGYVVANNDIEHYRLKQGDLLFSNINSPAHIGRTVYVDRDYDIYHGMNLLRIRINSSSSAKYIYYVLSSSKYKQWFERICNKAVNQASINQTDLGKTLLPLPSIEEQQKIADFLTALDDKIELENKKLQQAKLFKKFLLQRMFV